MSEFYNKYPYTDFHELNLDWVLERVKQLTEDWAATAADWESTEAAWNDLHDYVMDYFADLNVQDEINHKLDVMAADGTLDALLLPYFNAYKVEINGIVAQQNAKLVEQDSDIEVLDNRISALAHLSEGSTTGDAELADIRVPYNNFNNNVNYDDAGDAVRGQIGTLAESADNRLRTSAETATVENKVLTVAGNLAANNDWRCAIVSMHEADEVRVKGLFNVLNSLSYLHVGFYYGKTPSADNFISGLNFTPASDPVDVFRYIRVPAGAQCAVFCTRDTSISGVEIVLSYNKESYTKISDSFIDGYGIKPDGTLSAISSWKVTDFINVKNNSAILFDADLNAINLAQWTALAFYDDYGQIIDSNNGLKSYYAVPAGATYARYMISSSSSIDGHYLVNRAAAFPEINTQPANENIMTNYENVQHTVNGLTFTKTGARYTIAGTASSYNAAIQIIPVKLARGKKYNISYASAAANVYIQYGNDTAHYGTLSRTDSFTVASDALNPVMRLLVNTTSGTTYNITVDIELTEADKGYEIVHIDNASDLYDFLYNFTASETKYKVYLDAASFDLYTGLFEDYITADEMHFNLNEHYLHNVEIIGNGAVISLKVPEAAVTAHRSSANTVSAFNVKGNVYIHDLTIDAENCRYCIHDESLSAAIAHYTEHRYENVILKYNRTSGDVALVMQCIGIGGSLGQRYMFNNCKFYRTGTGGLGGCFYIHGRDYNIESLEFNNCIFNGTTTTKFLLSQYTGNDRPTDVNMINCIINGDITIKPQTSSGFNKQQWAVTVFNSSFTQIDAQDTGTWPLVSDPVVANSITGQIS